MSKAQEEKRKAWEEKKAILHNVYESVHMCVCACVMCEPQKKRRRKRMSANIY